MTIYLDIIFIENIVMNFIILLATGLILKRKVSYVRLFFSSVLGGIYVVVYYVTNMQTLYGLSMKILLSIAMTYIAFNSKGIKVQIKEVLTFYLVSVVFGGTAIAAIYFIKPQNIIMKNGVYVGRYAALSILIGGILGFILINIVFKIIKRRITKLDMYCKMKIELNNKSEIIKTMIDTGNMLKDPISKKPVAIIDKKVAERILPKQLIENINKILKGEFYTNDEQINKYISKLKIIPFSSLGKEHRINYCFSARYCKN